MPANRPSLETLFGEALARTDPGGRAAYLDRACGDDSEVRRQLEGLLAAHDRAGRFLDPPNGGPGSVTPTAAATGAGSAPSPAEEGTLTAHVASGETTLPHRPLREGVGTVIGPYKLLQEIGQGGMGSVFMAEQEKPVKRRVALKVIKAGMDSDAVIARFEAERQALALMDHPNIARVLDAGQTDSGRPYFVMELVKGIPITRYCDDRRMSPKERLALFIPVCQAIQHAHQKGIIHRDVKPSNVLVTEVDGKPVPKVIDFGVAKATDQRLTERTLFTQFGAIVGTPEYMSPEQADVSALDVDTRADIYSLGALLYELLTGSTPLDRTSLRDAAMQEILRRIREEEPPKPSTRLSASESLPSVSAVRNTEPARLSRLIRGDLDWIVMKALDKDRSRRYETANGFARDIQRYLEGDAVEASPPSARYRLGKLARKHRAALATVGAFALLLLAATAVSAGLALWANHERVRALKAEKLAQQQQERAQEREIQAIEAVKRFRDAVGDEPALKNSPELENLRKRLLKEPLTFFRSLRDRLHADGGTSPEALPRLARAVFELGSLTNEIGDKQDALRVWDDARAIFERLTRENPTVTQFYSNLADSHNNIGNLQSETGQSEAALRSHEQAQDILEQLGRENPAVPRFQNDVARGHYNIGNLQLATGQREAALRSYEQARASQERLARENPVVADFQSGLALIHNAIGNLQSDTGESEAALRSHEQALAIRERLVRESPTVIQFQSDLANSHNNIGKLLRDMGQPKAAIGSIEQARAIYEQLAQENAAVTEFQSDLARTHNNIGVFRAAMGQPEEALQSLEKARAIRERLTREHPTVTEFQSDLAGSHLNIGNLLREMDKQEPAMRSYEQAKAIFERLALGNKTVTKFQRDLAAIHNNIGNVQRDTGQHEAALRSFEQAEAIREILARDHPESPEFASDQGATLGNLARLDLDAKRFETARDRLRQAIALQTKALAANPRNPQYRQFLGNDLDSLVMACAGLGDDHGAVLAQRQHDELIASDPRLAALDERLAAIRKGVAPKDNAERLALAQRAYDTKRFATAARLWGQALEADAKLADDRQAQHRYNAACAAALAGTTPTLPSPVEGEGQSLDAAAMATLRARALDWLKAELAEWTRRLDSAEGQQRAMIVQTLQHWKADTDLAGVRDPEALAELPESERAEWAALWARVDALLRAAVDGAETPGED